jgi:2-hydroxy-3-oxopropionate reductase
MMTRNPSRSASSAWASWARRWRPPASPPGHQLFVHTRSKVPAAIAGSGATPAPPRGRGRAGRHRLPDGARHARRGTVLFGEQGVASGLTAGKVVVDMSSISPIATKAFAAARSTRWAATTSTRRCPAARWAPRRHADHHGRRRARHVSSASSRCSSDGQEHHPGGRQRRRPDHQGGQPDHRGAEHRRGGEALVFASKAGADPAKVRQALMGGFAPAASSRCTASA